MEKKWAILVIIILLFSSFLSGCTTDNKKPNVIIVTDVKVELFH